MSAVHLRMTCHQHGVLRRHLFAGDGKEAVAVALCGRGAGLDVELLLVHRILLIPHDQCTREADRVDWSPAVTEDLLREAAVKGLAVLKVHSHPSGFDRFSVADDESDRLVFESVFGWVDGDRPHGSAVMLPSGRVFARAVFPGGRFAPMPKVMVVGDEVQVWRHGGAPKGDSPAFVERHAQLFGAGTTNLLRGLRVAVVGCSGTGSLVIEQLARLGVDELVLVDDDHVEERNLNRIVGATMEDAQRSAAKVDVLARNVKCMGLGTKVYPKQVRADNPQARAAIAASDVIMGCVDSLFGRQVLARMSRYFLMPYVDVGVKLEALPDGTINQVAGSVHYVQPDGGDLLARGVLSAEALASEDLRRTDPAEFEAQVKMGYIKGVAVDRPAVISVNTVFAGIAVNELLARLHPFRMDPNEVSATTRLSLSHLLLEQERDVPPSSRALECVGRGEASPPLGMVGLS